MKQKKHAKEKLSQANATRRDATQEGAWGRERDDERRAEREVAGAGTQFARSEERIKVNHL